MLLYILLFIGILVMAKVTLNTIGSRYGSIDALNDNFEALEEALENTLSRDGTTPNEMGADLDMNSHDIINVGEISVDSLRLGGLPVTPGTLTYNGVVKETIVAEAGQTVFDLTSITYAPFTNNLSVYIDGVYQNPSRYTETDSNTVTLSEGVHEGAVVDFQVMSLNDLGGTADACNVTYTPAGSGAVTTTVCAKLAQTVSVKDFGAVGDGVTDDTAAIQAAIDASYGKNLQFVDGENYKITAPILVGAGNSTADPASISGKATITAAYEQDSTTLGFGNPDKKQSALHCLATPGSGTKLNIQGLSLIYTGTFDEGTNNGRVNGIFMYGYDGGLIDDVSATGFNACGAFIGGSGGSYTTIQTNNITVQNSDFSGNRVAGVEIAYTDNVRVLFNTLNENGLSGDTGTGYGFAAQSGTQVTNLKVVGNTANGNYRKGLDTHAVNGVLIDGNSCDNNFLYGIFVSTTSKGDAIVTNNRVTGMTASTTGSRTPVYGIYVGQDQATTSPDYLNVTVANNHVEVSQDSGAVAYPVVCRTGGDNRFSIRNNVFDCGTITHFLLCDDRSGIAELYVTDNVMMADSVASYYAKIYQKNITNLEFSDNTIIHRGSYFLTEAINFDTTDAAPAAAVSATKHVEWNKLDVTAAGSMTFFINESSGAQQVVNYYRGAVFTPRPTYTIASGVITVGNFPFLIVATEGGAATDDLDTISGGYVGQRIILTAASSSNDVVVKDATGNLQLNGDFTLTNGRDTIELVYAGANGWYEVSRSDNSV